jgi:hypothetical protein
MRVMTRTGLGRALAITLRRGGLGPILALSFAVTPAQAQTTKRNPAAAQALFDEARKLLDAGQYDQACPKFRQSFDLDPGGGTLLNLADCYERQGLSASAWTTFKDARVLAERDGRQDRVEYARDHINQLESRLAYLTVRVPEPSRVPGISVSVDGAPIGEAAWGVALPVDPGQRVVRAEAPGKQAYERVVDVPRATLVRESLEIPPLTDVPVEAPKTAAAPVLSNDGGGAPEDPSTPSDGRATAGWIVGGAGIVALGVGGFFGLRAMSRWDERNDLCRGGCTQEAKDAGDDASTAANLATIASGVGIVGVGVGAFLLLTSGGRERASATTELPLWLEARSDGAEIMLRSRW